HRPDQQLAPQGIEPLSGTGKALGGSQGVAQQPEQHGDADENECAGHPVKDGGVCRKRQTDGHEIQVYRSFVFHGFVILWRLARERGWKNDKTPKTADAHDLCETWPCRNWSVSICPSPPDYNKGHSGTCLF